MNGRTARMLRKMSAHDKKSKRFWKSLTDVQRGTVRATYKVEGPSEAVVTFMEQLRK